MPLLAVRLLTVLTRVDSWLFMFSICSMPDSEISSLVNWLASVGLVGS